MEHDVCTWGVENSQSSAGEVAAGSYVLIAGPQLLRLHLPGHAEVEPAASPHTAVHVRLKLQWKNHNDALSDR